MSALRIKVTLLGFAPPIWRRLEVPADTELAELQWIIQRAMGWQDEHLYGFYLKPSGSKSKIFRNWQELDPDSSVPLQELLQRRSDEIVYEYDFGDSWIHSIKLEKVLPGSEHSIVPRCVAGERACPPENCGGPFGYAACLEAMSDESHPEHEDTLEWLGDTFDPEHFDVEAVNKVLAKGWNNDA